MDSQVTVIKDVKEFETKYPLYAAVNRCSRGKTLLFQPAVVIPFSDPGSDLFGLFNYN